MQKSQSFTLSQITTQFQNSSITLTKITQSVIRLEVLTPPKNKNISYQINIKHDCEQAISSIINLLGVCAYRRIRVEGKEKELYKILLSRIGFQEVILMDEIFVDELDSIVKFPPMKLIYQVPVSSEKLMEVYSKLCTSCNFRQVLAEIRVLKFDCQSIVKILKFWVDSTLEHKFSYQKLVIHSHSNSSFFILEKHEKFGYSFCLKELQTTQPLIQAILSQLFSLSSYFSLEICHWDPYHLQALAFILSNNQCQPRYLIKLANFIQITNQQFLINTVGISESQVKQIYELIKVPGHYQLICHSSVQYFKYAISVFLSKPLIKFKYYVPLDQFSGIQEAVSRMQDYAQKCGERIRMFMMMVEGPDQLKFDDALKLYSSLERK